MTYQPGSPQQNPLAVAPAPRKGLSTGKQAGLYIGGGLMALLLACCGGSFMIGALSDPAGKPRASADQQNPSTTQASPLSDAAVAPETSPTPSPVAQPVVEKRTVTETQAIPFGEKRVNDPTLAAGKTRVKTQGVPGVRTLTYEVTLTDGTQTEKKLLSSVVTKAPITKVVLVGTKKSSSCDPNYIWACVPIASDVDCAGGSGNGPAYVQGPVKVVGSDIYDLDRDGDGIGCED